MLLAFCVPFPLVLTPWLVLGLFTFTFSSIERLWFFWLLFTHRPSIESSSSKVLLTISTFLCCYCLFLLPSSVFYYCFFAAFLSNINEISFEVLLSTSKYLLFAVSSSISETEQSAGAGSSCEWTDELSSLIIWCWTFTIPFWANCAAVGYCIAMLLFCSVSKGLFSSSYSSSNKCWSSSPESWSIYCCYWLPISS